MGRKTIIITNNREIYDGFNSLFFTNEIRLHNAKKVQIERILSNVNKKNKILESYLLDDFIVIKKLQPLNYSIYLR